MEFYEELPANGFDNSALQQHLSIHNLPRLCRSIETVIYDNQTSGVIYCLWGQYEINREQLKSGVRFSLPTCPNALAWTITLTHDVITVHCTINKKNHDEDFIASIYKFMADWVEGLRQVTRH